MKVSELMQRDVATLDENDRLDLADDVMRLGRIRHMPVVAEGRLVGIVSQRDLFRAGLSSVMRLHDATQRNWLAHIPVRDVMTREVTTVRRTTPVREAAALMLERSIGCLPVVEDGQLVGLLSESDCLRHLVQVLALEEQRGQLPELQ